LPLVQAISPIKPPLRPLSTLPKTLDYRRQAAQKTEAAAPP
jgi:hypothetical protein